ncbi:Futalosine hydrolase [compost metagenome]
MDTDMNNKLETKNMYSGPRILVMTAVSVERDAVLRGLNGSSRFDVVVAGVGPIAAAVSTAKKLATGDYGLVVSAGIAGGFADRAEVGSLVVASEMVGADLGVQTAEGFSSLDELNYGITRVQVEPALAAWVTGALLHAGLQAITGPVLTVSTATGTTVTAMELAARVPDAAAEAMEGFGVAAAAREYGLPVLEIRAISNQVGPRDLSAWKFKEALDALASASAVLTEVLQ